MFSLLLSPPKLKLLTQLKTQRSSPSTFAVCHSPSPHCPKVAFEMTTSSVSQSSNYQMVLKRKSNDVGWEYGLLVDAKNLDKVQCIKCGKMMSGGVYRIKEHIAHITGNVASCKKASKEDQAICRNAINEAKLKKKKKKYEGEELRNVASSICRIAINEAKLKKKDEDEELRSQVNIHNGPDEEDAGADQLQESFGSMKSPRAIVPTDQFVSVINPEASWGSGKSKLREQNINDALFKQRTEAVKEYVCRWVYEAGISFNSIEVDSFKLMMEAVGQFGPGFVPPTRYEMTKPLLKKEIDRTKGLLKTHEEEWKLNGCSIMTNAWSDRIRRSTVNLCVNSRFGTVFLSSKDFSDIADTSAAIFEYVDQCIEQIGPDNVVQIVTDNASNNIGVAKLLKEKRPKIVWTSCASHTIDLMLEAIANQPRFKKVIDQAKTLTVFFYAHHKVLAMMRFHTKKRDIVRPGVTRFASAFLTLQSLYEKRSQLKMMFGSREWEECKFFQSVEGKVAYTIVMSMNFWNGVALCLRVCTPLVKVLRIVDCDKKPSMGFVYGELVQAKEEIKLAQNNLSKNYESIIEVIDARIKGRLDSPLHLMAYVLNPFFYYKNPLLYLDQDVSLGVIDCLEVLYPGEIDLQNKIISEELPMYKAKESTFGKTLAVKACYLNDAKFDPVNWWSNFGAITPNLQRLAMRILSLTTSSSGCERNWSAFEEVHTKKRNRVGTNLLNNLVFVQFNARLLSKQKREKDRSDVEVLFSYNSTYAQEWIVDGIANENNVGEDESPTPNYQRMRELYEDDFEYEDEVTNEKEVEYESYGDRVLEDLNI